MGVYEETVGLVRSTTVLRDGDPITSIEAAESVSKASREASEKAVLWALAHGPQTDQQIFARVDGSSRWAGWNWEPSRIRTARAQLVDSGDVIDTGRKGITSKGRQAILWALAGTVEPHTALFAEEAAA